MLSCSLQAQQRLTHLCATTASLHDIGIVERAPNSSDEDSDPDDDEIEDDNHISRGGKLPPGTAKVRWNKREDVRTEFTENLVLVDRVFLLGDIVARSIDQLGQTGIVAGMRMFCDVRKADGSVLSRVPTRLLKPLASCRPGALVVHATGHWLGRVDEVFDNVQITFDDGASCKVMRTGANSLRVHSPTMDEQTWFWPGMRVSASREILRRSKWIKGSFRAGYADKVATVLRVQAAQVLVRWLAAAPVDEKDAGQNSAEPPSDTQRPSRLIELTQHHARSCWRLAEHALLTPSNELRLATEKEQAARGEDEGAGIGSSAEPVEGRDASLASKRSSGNRQEQTSHVRQPSPIDDCVEIVGCHTRVDIIWQDGTQELDGAAVQYAPAKHVDGYYEFWPQDYVVGTSIKDGISPPVGVVESVNHDQRMCVVKWRDGDSSKDGAGGEATETAREKVKHEMVPVYDIAPHPDFSFKIGVSTWSLTGFKLDSALVSNSI